MGHRSCPGKLNRKPQPATRWQEAAHQGGCTRKHQCTGHGRIVCQLCGQRISWHTHIGHHPK